mmetsp:Transcript_26602/g.82705  ORF Transcript_26602/g.82705 Transcript_26602/m.82705 type:complete len:217 (+) Transcript_26602:404-1054(+)
MTSAARAAAESIETCSAVLSTPANFSPLTAASMPRPWRPQTRRKRSNRASRSDVARSTCADSSASAKVRLAACHSTKWEAPPPAQPKPFKPFVASHGTQPMPSAKNSLRAWLAAQVPHASCTSRPYFRPRLRRAGMPYARNAYTKPALKAVQSPRPSSKMRVGSKCKDSWVAAASYVKLPLHSARPRRAAKARSRSPVRRPRPQRSRSSSRSFSAL